MRNARMHLVSTTVAVMATLAVATRAAQSTAGAPQSSADQSTPTATSAVLVPATGVTDLGGTFGGTLQLQSFVVQGNTIAATGTLSGVMSNASGVRNLILPVVLPLDVQSSIARRQTDPALASCDTLHLDFAPTVIGALGTNIAFDAVALDISGGGASSPASAAATGPTAATPTPSAAPSSTTGTMVTGTSTPGAVVPAPTQTVPTTSTLTPLSTVLCGFNGLTNAASNPTQTVAALNQVLAAVRNTKVERSSRF